MMWQTLILITLSSPANVDKGISLCKQREYEEGYELLCKVHEYNVSPARQAEYFFYKGLAAHQLRKRKEAEDHLNDLISGFYVEPPPQRYIAVAYAMLNDMQTWKDDIGDLSRRMKGVARRLDLGKGGPQTKKEQKEILAKLDEMIKQAENKSKQKNNKDKNGGGCPSGEQQPQRQDAAAQQASKPMEDSQPGGTQGKGIIEDKKVRELAQVWGKLPEKERAKAMVDLTRGMPPKYRDAIESYFRTLQTKSNVHKP